MMFAASLFLLLAIASRAEHALYEKLTQEESAFIRRQAGGNFEAGGRVEVGTHLPVTNGAVCSPFVCRIL
jgi:hypothetical protein